MNNPRRTYWTAAIERSICALMITLGLGESARAQIPCRYEITHIIQGPGCSNPSTPSSTFGTAISPDGHWVVGFFNQCPLSENRAFYYDTTTRAFHSIPLGPGFYSSSAEDVNNDGVVVGTGNRTNIGQRGFVYRIAIGEWTELLPLPGGVWSGATGINASGVVCGWRSVGPGTQPTTAFIWSAQNGFTDLGLINGYSTEATGINDSGVVCGWRGNLASSPTARGFVWSGKKIVELPVIPGGNSSACLAINASGQTCGHGLYPSPTGSGNVVHAFLSDSNILRDIGVLPGFLRTFALDLSGDGTIVGYCRTLTNGADVIRGYTWRDGLIRDLNDLVPHADLDVEVAASLDKQGDITGQGINSQGSVVAFVLSPVHGNIADVNNDCLTNVNDLLLVIGEWHQSNTAADVNHDGTVDVNDLMLVVQNWTIKLK